MLAASAVTVAPGFAQTTAKPAAPTEKPAAPAAAPAAPAASAAKYGPGLYAIITMDQGVMIARLFPKEAPITVENVVGLAEGKKSWRNPRTGTMVRRPYYNGLIFHRIIPKFMIQGGDPTGTGTGGAGFSWVDEFNPTLRHNKAGILSMANAGPNTNNGQFFITLAPTPHLDNRHSVFGELVEGLDVLQAIGSVPTNKADNRPLKPVIMRSVRIERVS
jgi:cyclophilin family peptidyl-prolyl cis-trans isomerase